MERFWSKVDKTDTCWLWTGSTDRDGYGRFTIKRKDIPAHRFAHELLIGPIPKGLTIDHLCRVRNCVKPDHLEAVTNRENILRGESFSAINARKTHCIQGHPYFGDNLYVKPNGNRECRICKNIHNREWLKKQRKVAI